MCYKLVACILLILSVHSLVLAAPVPGEEVIIASGKRAARGNPYERMDSGSGSIGTLPGKTGVPLDPNLNDHPPDVNLDSAGPTTENKPASAKSASWDPTPKVHLLTDSPNLPPPPGREGYLAKVGGQPSSSSEIEEVWSPNHFDLPPPSTPGRGGYLTKVVGQQSSSPNIEYRPLPTFLDSPPWPTPPPKSKGFMSKVKEFIGKKFIGELGGVKFRPS